MYERLSIKRYASPGGTSSTSVLVISHCSNRPPKGALNGLLLAKKDEKGSTPSLPSSWTTVRIGDQYRVS